MPDATPGVLSMADAQSALTAPPEEDRPRGEDGKFAPKAPSEPAKPATADNKQVEGDDAPEGEEVDEISEQAQAAADNDAAEEAATEIPAPEDAAEQPSIDPPAGWTPEDREWFKSLPPEKQEVIAKREREYRANESRRFSEHQAALKAREAEMAAAQTERQNLSQALKTYANPVYGQYAAEFADVIEGKTNVVQMQADDPLRFQRFQAFQTEFQRIDAVNTEIQKRQQEDGRALFTQYRERENAKFREAAKIKTDAEWQKTDAEITDYLRSFTDDEGQRAIPDQHIVNASAAQLLIVRKAMLHDKAMAAKPVAKVVPQVQKPGVANTKAERDTEKSAALLKRLDRTGSLEDALALMRQH